MKRLTGGPRTRSFEQRARGTAWYSHYVTGLGQHYTNRTPAVDVRGVLGK
jgi:hypothetical protein